MCSFLWPTVKKDAVGIMKLDIRLMLVLDIPEGCCPLCTANHGYEYRRTGYGKNRFFRQIF